MSDPANIPQLLASLSAHEKAAWSSEFPKPALPEGAPSLARLYTAILREDWTDAEWRLIQENLLVRQMYHNAQASVWYPTPDQLRKYADAQLPADLQADIEHHLEVDKCQHSLRLLGWAELPARGSVSHEPFAVAVKSGFASSDSESRTLINDEQVRLIHDPQTNQFRLSSKSLRAGTLMQVVMIGAKGQPMWQRFALLWDTFRDEAMGRCESPSPDAACDLASRTHNSIICSPVALDKLDDADAYALQKSWQWSQEHQPKSLESWAALAMKLGESTSSILMQSLSKKLY